MGHARARLRVEAFAGGEPAQEPLREAPEVARRETSRERVERRGRRGGVALGGPGGEEPRERRGRGRGAARRAREPGERVRGRGQPRDGARAEPLDHVGLERVLRARPARRGDAGRDRGPQRLGPLGLERAARAAPRRARGQLRNGRAVEREERAVGLQAARRVRPARRRRAAREPRLRGARRAGDDGPPGRAGHARPERRGRCLGAPRRDAGRDALQEARVRRRDAVDAVEVQHGAEVLDGRDRVDGRHGGRGRVREVVRGRGVAVAHGRFAVACRCVRFEGLARVLKTSPCRWGGWGVAACA